MSRLFGHPHIFTVDEPHHINAQSYPNQSASNPVLEHTIPNDDDGFNRGLNYSIIDLSVIGANGSIGEVITRNVHLITYDTNPNGEEIKFKCGEKITGVKNFSDNSYWVVAHFVNRFYAFKVSSAGVNHNPVISVVGTTIPLSGYRRNALGQIKISPDASKLAVAHNQLETTLGSESNTSGLIELFNFNSFNGQVTNALTIKTSQQFYGLEFSPNSKRLYVSHSFNQVSQFNLEASFILGSEVLFNTGGQCGQIQLGPNNKIYVAKPLSGTLSVINQPNNLGISVGFQQNGVVLANNTKSLLGLPPFITSFFNPGIVFQNNCLGEATQFNLQTNQAVINATWNFGDGNTSNQINPTHTYSSVGTYNVSVTASTAQETVTRSRQITIFSVPQANMVNNQNICMPSNSQSINLVSTFNATLLGDQNPNQNIVKYYQGLANFNNQISISNPTAFTLQANQNYTIYAIVENAQNSTCKNVTSFNLQTFLQPSLANLNPWVICQSTFTGFHSFDLASLNQTVFNPTNPQAFVWQYFSTETDANNNQNPLPLPYTNTLPTETLYVRVHQVSNPSCFATKPFTIQVIAQPQTTNVSTWQICSTNPNGIETVNLQTKVSEILNGQSNILYQVTFHTTAVDANSNQNALPANFTNNNLTTTIHYRITALASNSCFATGSLMLQVTPAIVLQQPNTQYFCDTNNDLVMAFTLSDYVPLVLGNLNPNNYQISFHLSLSDANTQTNALPNNYQNTTAQETWWVRVQSLQNANCFSVANIPIQIFKKAVAHTPPNMQICDDNSNDGIATFVLTNQNAAILQNQSPNEYSVSYYVSINDANLQLNSLPANYTNTQNQQTIFARVTNVFTNECSDITTFTLLVRALPLQAANEEVILCQGKSIVLQVPLGFSSYLWSTGATSRSIAVAQPGIYTVQITQTHGALVCTDTKTFVVKLSNPATINNVITTDWTENSNSIQIEVSGLGDYFYSIDGTNFQASPNFSNLSFGFYTVYVKDNNQCGITTKNVYLHYYPKYFTPNEDGINDFWHVKGALFLPEMKVHILDRFGKLITSFLGNSPGWDGNFNNQALPSTDYWFVVEMPNGIVHKGHFSLLR